MLHRLDQRGRLNAAGRSHQVPDRSLEAEARDPQRMLSADFLEGVRFTDVVQPRAGAVQ